ncbi:MDR family MFS transporter [Thermoflavimicrobium dichotomicum]|uniref:Drug resistance transporter, EmrB/QacA subfamily n=1 Tax=Thermoflavimicrobium dichotomicum TaxID=46223 RepID=A0A1I3RG81_9BACL|nr:MDR family MFS transporter [Thermoflavimicrobium dichotomicum]SFJ45278.1 drug resistance transporter, EmrB/QacA subfamily [Thermoflavimicrobium dichotomicum]
MTKTKERNVAIALLISILLAAVESTIVSTAIPTLVSDLGGAEWINWVIAIYFLTSSIATPIYGKLADLFGRKIIFTVGASIFLLGSLLCGLAQNIHQLIGFRAIQGLGAGGILPITATIMGDLYSYEKRAKMQGWVSTVWGIAGIIGPIAGGIIVDYLSWHWIFLINLPIGAVSLTMIWLFLHETVKKKEKKYIDYPGAITFTIAMTALLFAMQAGGTLYAWNSPVTFGLFASAFLFLGVFIWIQKKSADPLLPLQIFQNSTLLFSNIAGFTASAVLTGMVTFIPIWMQGIKGFSATASGITLIPLSIAWAIGATFGGRALIKLGPRKTVFIGFSFLLMGTSWLATVDMETPRLTFMMITSIMGLGFGFSFTTMTVTIQSVVSWEIRAAATASNTFIRSLGSTIGIAILGTIFNHMVMQASLKQGYTISKEQLDQILNPHASQHLSSTVLFHVREALASGIQTIFILLTALAVLTFLTGFRMPKHKPESNPQTRPS